MTRIFVKPENREKFKEIERLIAENGWEVKRMSVTDQHEEDGKTYLREELIIKRET